jgi:hypothetical protein
MKKLDEELREAGIERFELQTCGPGNFAEVKCEKIHKEKFLKILENYYYCWVNIQWRDIDELSDK